MIKITEQGKHVLTKALKYGQKYISDASIDRGSTDPRLYDIKAYVGWDDLSGDNTSVNAPIEVPVAVHHTGEGFAFSFEVKNTGAFSQDAFKVTNITIGAQWKDEGSDPANRVNIIEGTEINLDVPARKEAAFSHFFSWVISLNDQETLYIEEIGAGQVATKDDLIDFKVATTREMRALVLTAQQELKNTQQRANALLDLISTEGEGFVEYKRQLNTIQEEIDALKEKIDAGGEVDFTEINAEINTLDRRITSTNNVIVDLKDKMLWREDLDQLNQPINELGAKIDTLKQDVKNLQDNPPEADLTDVNQKINSIEAELNTLKETASQGGGGDVEPLKEAIESINEEIVKVNTAVEKLKKDMLKKASTSDFEKVDKNVGQLMLSQPTERDSYRLGEEVATREEAGFGVNISHNQLTGIKFYNPRVLTNYYTNEKILDLKMVIPYSLLVDPGRYDPKYHRLYISTYKPTIKDAMELGYVLPYGFGQEEPKEFPPFFTGDNVIFQKGSIYWVLKTHITPMPRKDLEGGITQFLAKLDFYMELKKDGAGDRWDKGTETPEIEDLVVIQRRMKIKALGSLFTPAWNSGELTDETIKSIHNLDRYVSTSYGWNAKRYKGVNLAEKIIGFV